jgi:phosphoenolpyruvate synthase/pyruvate phosphate dikinase
MSATDSIPAAASSGTTEYVLPLAHADPAEVALMGGKAARLAALMGEGVSVPAGYCITTAALRHFLRSNGVPEDRLGCLADPCAAAFRMVIRSGAMPAAVREEIAHALALLGGDSAAVAVRSSAVVEDGLRSSYAGQHESYLNVGGLARVEECVRGCWSSLFTQRAIQYRSSHGHPVLPSGMAVILQQFVPADRAGVTLSADPVSGRDDEVIVTACFGLGDALVSGVVTPDEYRFSRASGLTTIRVGEKAVESMPRRTGGVERRPVGSAHRHARVLTDDEVAAAAELALDAAALFGSPQEVEWAITGARMDILQSRPITSRSLHG